ncbi:hypothetical protein M4951_16805 [Blastopirellula sp. J2-11]|uniref:hypothetical protein n=1 Tax=Blastopirellula sp. J2-11 TaxID=2943192 RepID=UPI0021C7781B|nr:hypothetical protein [Blastopirellula sp. J2-11]UUO05039.1 hypothetical protein M4951_16805 [Blastopirellula sp. J2-11]
MLRFVLALLCAATCSCALPQPVLAQLGPYNPYAKPMDDAPPVAADGTLHWPVFYRSTKMELKYENLHNLGACLGTNKSVTVPVEKNKLNIDTLPEVSVSGRVVQIGKGSMLLQQADGKIDMIVTHPAGVSRVDVTGDVPAAWLKSGMLVRFLGQVDSHGHGAEPLDAIDVMSTPGDFAPPEVAPGHRQNITAVVKSLRGKTLVVTTLNGTLRKLTFTLSEEAIAHLMTQELEYASLGDELTAKGHLYTVAGAKPDRCVFASDVTVSKHATPTAAAEEVTQTPLSKL